MDQNKKTVISVTDLTIGYGDRTVLEKLTFDVYEDEAFIILGGSGCGKSTLLKHLIGLYDPFNGDIRIHGESIVNADVPAKRKLMQKFGVTYQGGALFSSMTLAENVALPLEEFTDYPKEKIDTIVRQKLAMVDLTGFEDFLPAEISGGMKKRAGLARALALEPKLLFFDEPSAGLDPISSAQLDRLIIRLKEQLKTTIVIVTHELDSIFAVGDRAIMLDRETKSIAATGNPRKLRTESDNPWVTEFLNRSGLSR